MNTVQKRGALASFLLAAGLLVAEWIYLTGNLREPGGPLAYGLADFLYGPVSAAALVTAVVALQEHIGERASRRTSLALLAATLSAAMFVAAALIRSTNRGYHLAHPELNLEMSSTVLTVWTTLVAGVIGTARHFLGWSLVLLGSAGWTSGRLPPALSVLYWLVGAVALFAYLLPDGESVALPVAALCIWQGILLWRAKPVIL